MKTVLILAMLCASMFAVQLRGGRVSAFSQLSELGERSEYAKNLVDTVLLHLQSQGKLDEIIKFLKDAHIAGVQARSDLNSEYKGAMDEFDTNIRSLESDERGLQGDIKLNLEQITQLQGEVDILNKQKETLTNALKALVTREENINQARQNDAAAFASRQERDGKALTALEQIIPQLEDLINGEGSLSKMDDKQKEEYIENKQVSKEIKNLIQTSMKFNRAKLQVAIQKLKTIQSAIAAAKELDETNEKESLARFAKLIDEIAKIRDAQNAELSQVTSQLGSKNAELQVLKGEKTKLQNNLKQTQQILERTRASRESSEKAYQLRLADADSSNAALQDAIKILSDGKEQIGADEEAVDSLQA